VPRLLWLLALAGCEPAGVSVSYPTRPAAGRPLACPEDAIDDSRDGTGRGTSGARCSYEDGAGKGLTHLHGRVAAPTVGGAPGQGLADVIVTVHPVGPEGTVGAPGRELARVRTDHQGTFSVGVKLPAGEVLLIARDPADDRVLGAQRIAVEGQGMRQPPPVVLTVQPSVPSGSDDAAVGPRP
jgi:hypothetical protein